MTPTTDPPSDLDPLAAHIDRGWDLLQKHDLSGARRSAQAALGVEADSPEALTLLGAIAVADGEDDEAAALWDRAIELDPEYVAPILYAAENRLDREEPEFEEALALIERALDLAEEEDEYLDALVLKAEALVAMHEEVRDREASQTLAELPPVDLPDAGYHLRIGRCFLDLDCLDDAEHHYRKAIAMEPELADAHHGLGLVFEAREDTRAMAQAWLRVRELDLGEEAVPWTLPEDEFERVAEEALAELPARIRKLLENVPIVAADYPSLEIVTEGNDPRMMGFFSGVPLPEKSSMGANPHLDCVFLYQRNIERVCRGRDDAMGEIRITLLHETGHFFGLSEEELEAMGLG